MLKSSNLESIINAVEAEDQQPLADDLPELGAAKNVKSLDIDRFIIGTTTNVLAKSIDDDPNTVHIPPANTNNQSNDSLVAQQLASGLLQIFEPPLAKARSQLKELIGKQNKIYIDLSAEKYKLDNDETMKLHEMMNNVKVYREKLVKIKKQMQNIYQRTKVLKKRAVNVQTSKQKELQRKLHKQQQEEALIGKQQQQATP